MFHTPIVDDAQARAYCATLDGPPSPAHVAFLARHGLTAPATQRQASALVNSLVIGLASEGTARRQRSRL